MTEAEYRDIMVAKMNALIEIAAKQSELLDRLVYDIQVVAHDVKQDR